VPDLTEFFTVGKVVEIAVLWIIVYGVLRYLQGTIAGAFLRTVGLALVIVIILAMQLFTIFGLNTLKTIVQ